MADIELADLPGAAPIVGDEKLPGLQSGAAVAITTQQIVDKARLGLASSAHTHTSSTITDFTEAVQDTVGAMLVAGTNVTVAYDDAAGTATISASAGALINDATSALGTTWSSQKIASEITAATGGGTFQEAVEDLIGTSIVAGTSMTVAYDDATGKTTISAAIAGGGGGGDLVAANNLSDLPDKAAARSNLGLGSSATQASTAFATAAQGAKADTALQPQGNLSGLIDVATARTNLGLGSAATQASTAFATAAQGAKADTAVQPGALAAVATSGSYNDLINKPDIGSGTIYYGTFTGNGATTAFTLTAAGGTAVYPGTVNSIFWTEGGVEQTPGTDFTLSGNVVTRTSPPASGVPIKWRVIGNSVSIGTPSPGTVTGASFNTADVPSIRRAIGAGGGRTLLATDTLPAPYGTAMSTAATDNAAAFDNLMLYAAANGYGEIHFPKGWFNFASRPTQRIPERVVLVGESGRAGTILIVNYAVANTTDAFLRFAGNGSGLRDLSIYKSATSTGGGRAFELTADASGYINDFCDITNVTVSYFDGGHVWDTYAVMIDGTARPGPSIKGVRDTHIHNLWTFGGVYAAGVCNISISNLYTTVLYIRGFSDSQSTDIMVTAISAPVIDIANAYYANIHAAYTDSSLGAITVGANVNGLISTGTAIPHSNIVVDPSSTVTVVAGSGLYSTFDVTVRQIALKSGCVTFPAAQIASSDPNTLDDYEEGTFTASLTASTSNPTVTWSANSCRYTKIGRKVTVDFNLSITGLSGGSGTVRLSLPFTAGASYYSYGPMFCRNFGSNTPVMAEVQPGQAYVNLTFGAGTSYTSGMSVQRTQVSELTSSSVIYGSVTYCV